MDVISVNEIRGRSSGERNRMSLVSRGVFPRPLRRRSGRGTPSRRVV